MKAYSIDFRQKILDTYHAEPISQKAIAKRFSVALSFVQKLLKQYRETKNLTPRTDRCGVKGKLNAEQLLILANWWKLRMMQLLKNSVIYFMGELDFPLVEQQ
jgi:transposase